MEKRFLNVCWECNSVCTKAKKNSAKICKERRPCIEAIIKAGAIAWLLAAAVIHYLDRCGSRVLMDRVMRDIVYIVCLIAALWSLNKAPLLLVTYNVSTHYEQLWWRCAKDLIRLEQMVRWCDYWCHILFIVVILVGTGIIFCTGSFSTNVILCWERQLSVAVHE